MSALRGFLPALAACVLAIGGAEVVTLRLDVESEVEAEFDRDLSDPERRRSRRFAFARDYRRFVVARGSLRRFLGWKLNLHPREIELELGPNGKPRLARPPDDLRFNLSRSGDLAVLAAALGRDVGIDIEEARELPETDELAARFLPPAELTTYLALHPADKSLGFLKIWTRLEAVAKAKGEGVAMGIPSDPRGWEIHEFTPAPGFAGALAIEGGLR